MRAILIESVGRVYVYTTLDTYCVRVAAHCCSIIRMKINKTWGIIGGVVVAAPLTIIAFIISVKLGIIVVITLLILVRLLRGPSDSGGIIGIDHVDLPRSRTYGGGFTPGGLYGGGGNLGTSFGVWGAEVRDTKGPRKEYYPQAKRPALSKKHRRELAAAISEAEARTGHQVLAVIDSLDEDRAAKADRVAVEWPAASIVVCFDPARKLFELRWRDASFALDTAHVATFAEMMDRSDLAGAIALLAEVLPVQTAGAELPDILED